MAVPPSASLEFAADALRLLVAVMAAAMTAIAVLAYRRTGTRRMAFVAAAFASFLLRVLVVEQLLATSSVPPDAVSLVRAVFDLVTLLFFAAAVLKN